MILYNITTKIEHDIHAAWLQFMQRDYIPVLMESGMFDSYKLSRLMGIDESDGLTYALQLELPSRPAFNIYQEKYFLAHQKMHDLKWKGKFVVFRSSLDVVEHG